jgi:hypothetical protein
MQSLSQIRTPNRFILFALIVAVIIVVSWRLAPARNTTQFLSVMDGFASDTSARANTSTDTQIQTLQDRLRSHPDDGQAFTQLGLLYIQKMIMFLSAPVALWR